MISKEAVDAAKPKILAHLATDGGKTFGHLMVACGLREGVTAAGGLPETRVLDRALQALRKAKQIRFVKGAWELTP